MMFAVKLRNPELLETVEMAKMPTFNWSEIFWIFPNLTDFDFDVNSMYNSLF